MVAAASLAPRIKDQEILNYVDKYALEVAQKARVDRYCDHMAEAGVMRKLWRFIISKI